MFSVLVFGIGVFSGAKVRVSEAYGAGRTENLDAVLGGFLRLALALGVVSTLAAVALASSLPYLSEHEQTGRLAQSYCTIRSLAIPFALATAAIAQYRQAIGDSKSGMHAALFANLIHIPLNALLIFGLGWGSDGAALASSIATLMELLTLVWVQRREGLGWSKGSLQEALSTLRFGWPTGAERWLDVAAFTALVALLARMGELQVAAHQIALQVTHFAFLPMVALSDALSVLVAQAIGAREPTAAARLTRYALKLGLSFAAGCAVVLVAFDQPIIQLFAHDSALIQTTRGVLWVGAILQLLNASYLVFRGTLRGLGDLRFVALVTVACAWLFTPPLTWYFGSVLGLGARGGWLALCAEVGAGLVVVAYRARAMLGNPAMRRGTRALAAAAVAE